MAIVAEILLADPTLPLVDLARELPSHELSITNTVLLGDGRHLVNVSVDDESKDAFERRVDVQPEVTSVTSIGETADGWLYQVTIDSTSELLNSHDPREFEGVLLKAAVTGEGVRELKVFSNYEAFSSLRDRCEVYDIPFELLNIASDPENPGKRDRFGLTDKQHRALSVAYDGGYYDSPRSMSTQELADELGIAAASASDLLRRAEQQLISQTLGPNQYLNTLTA
ncbi:helix-turn-helix domain-containing protein [Salinirubellus salinus]|uniref:Helix-turn-helix domain-containing protein n=1 Tax=Salinirubellus salinus TaxID=1364945 RepID=A0A9E7R226_9EURY|nr:helix-turn-helix domain-containing protein [Salinirubellus salinus]UWM53423.1 helix-turn-helix domain-containing protein [Salinirubellus salinus]